MIDHRKPVSKKVVKLGAHSMSFSVQDGFAVGHKVISGQAAARAEAAEWAAHGFKATIAWDEHAMNFNLYVEK